MKKWTFLPPPVLPLIHFNKEFDENTCIFTVGAVGIRV